MHKDEMCFGILLADELSCYQGEQQAVIVEDRIITMQCLSRVQASLASAEDKPDTTNCSRPWRHLSKCSVYQQDTTSSLTLCTKLLLSFHH